ncbi:MAG: hypothetical protein J2P37_36570, partial [Ktedonobacteraceae bacterium]|nr:hypothetical protein [Ktedonobacteraceae bacterium]
GLLLFLWLIRRLFRHVFASPLYDQNLVRRKTMRQAYRVRLRCYAIGPGVKPPTGTKTTSHSTGIQRFVAAQMEIWRQRQGLRALLNRLLAAYRQFHLAAGAGNYFVPHRIWFPQRTCTSWTRGLSWSRHLIDAETIAALWHLPPSSTLSSLSHLTHRWERSRLLSPDLARLVAHMEPIGISEHAGHRLGFAWPPECLEHHALLAGKSGEGKSTLIERLATLAMQRGGLVLIDPHGDLAEGVLRLVPTHRCDDVVWIDLADPAYAVGLNPLDVRLGRSRDTTVSHLITALKAIWHDAWGPRMENAFEFSLRTLFEANRRLCVQGLEHQQYTLLDVMSILTSESFCHALLSHVEDDFILRWWHTYYDPLSLTQQRDIINPVISKTAKFEHLIARRIIGQSRSTVDVARLIAEEKIILVKLAKGVVGEDIALVLGATILNLIQGALEAQGSLPMAERKQMPIFVDEFQTLLGVDWGALAELRKYGAAFYLATQSLEYLHREETELLFTLLANIKHIVAF